MHQTEPYYYRTLLLTPAVEITAQLLQWATAVFNTGPNIVTLPFIVITLYSLVLLLNLFVAVIDFTSQRNRTPHGAGDLNSTEQDRGNGINDD